MDEFILIVSVASSVLSVILFFKVWGMCNDVDRIMRKMTSTVGKEDITVLIIEGKYDEAEAVLNKTIAERIARMNKPEYAYSTETIDKLLINLFKEYEPYYKKMGRSIPETLKNNTGADVMEWYKYYVGKVEIK